MSSTLNLPKSCSTIRLNELNPERCTYTGSCTKGRITKGRMTKGRTTNGRTIKR